MELPAPLISEKVREHNFTNEAGYGGTTRFLKNIVGLWILQESRREWVRQGLELDYVALTREAQGVQAFRSLINPLSKTTGQVITVDGGLHEAFLR